jgi:hypothetical protein
MQEEVGPPVDVASSLHNEWDKVGLVGVFRRLDCRVSLGCPSRGGLAYVHVYRVRTCVRTYLRLGRTSVRPYVRTYSSTMHGVAIPWYATRAHMCAENHVCLGRIHGSQLRAYVL